MCKIRGPQATGEPAFAVQIDLILLHSVGCVLATSVLVGGIPAAAGGAALQGIIAITKTLLRVGNTNAHTPVIVISTIRVPQATGEPAFAAQIEAILFHGDGGVLATSVLVGIRVIRPCAIVTQNDRPSVRVGSVNIRQ